MGILGINIFGQGIQILNTFSIILGCQETMLLHKKASFPFIWRLLYKKTPFAQTNKVEGEIEKTNGNGQWNEAVPYPCNDCDKKFSHKLGLYKHIKSVHEGAKYPCDECGHISTRKDHLHTHMKRRHSTSQELKLQ